MNDPLECARPARFACAPFASSNTAGHACHNNNTHTQHVHQCCVNLRVHCLGACPKTRADVPQVFLPAPAPPERQCRWLRRYAPFPPKGGGPSTTHGTRQLWGVSAPWSTVVSHSFHLSGTTVRAHFNFVIFLGVLEPWTGARSTGCLDTFARNTARHTLAPANRASRQYLHLPGQTPNRIPAPIPSPTPSPALSPTLTPTPSPTPSPIPSPSPMPPSSTPN